MATMRELLGKESDFYMDFSRVLEKQETSTGIVLITKSHNPKRRLLFMLSNQRKTNYEWFEMIKDVMMKCPARGKFFACPFEMENDILHYHLWIGEGKFDVLVYKENDNVMLKFNPFSSTPMETKMLFEFLADVFGNGISLFQEKELTKN